MPPMPLTPKWPQMPPTVLHIDDAPGIQRLLRRVLQDAGYPVLHVPDVPAALAVLRSGTTPLVVLFNTSAPPGGLRLLEAVQADPALQRHAYGLLTADPDGLSLRWRTLLATLAVPVLGKPFALDDLLTLVAAAAARLVYQPAHDSPTGAPPAHDAPPLPMTALPGR